MMLGNGYASSPASRRRRGRPRGGGGSGYGFWQPQSLHHHQQQEISPVVPPCTEFDMAYFRAYSHIGVHEEMLKDRVRTETYRAAIMRYQHLISDKVVLDVGCGTGILAIFCAFAGARRVYAVDASEIAVQASEVVKENNLSDKVTVLLGRVEDVSIDEKVDVIVSEWMGYILLYESMLPSIIFARDKWLKPGGLILPSHASLYMAPVTHADRYRESIDFWRDVYGINMSAMLPLAKQCAFEEPCIETISGENVLTWPILVKEVDCYTVTIQELESVTAKFSFSSMLRAPLHGFAFWFDVVFNGPANYSSNHHLQPPLGSLVDQQTHGSSQNKKRIKSDEGIVLSTAPEDAPTHWQQTLLYLYDPIELQQDQKIEGSVTLSQSKENARFLNIHLEYSSGGRSFVKESVMR
ncbi:probable protein arginine N-methyltransferase 6.2 [Musa acuminata AAA Group]|uniref:Protein arginine N-methyltransferase domain-containing protein n=1 Tax=Musa acuminata subsp. malaccensis TaxID=214687 RepID=A0A804KLE1_MUSAM|nr:PREDICTED: probable protein arginine N-methyltransferase 6.2 [Musa acuminata subsp. malaccensis]